MTSKVGTRTEERRLVNEMLGGADSAFETFADHYIPGLYRFALKQLGGNEELARDLSQTAICKAIDKLESFRGDSSLFTWLCACCKNEIRMHYRSESRRPTMVDLDAPEFSVSQNFSTEGNQERDLLRNEALSSRTALVHQILDDLPPRYASVLSMKYLEKRPVTEIANQLDIGPKAAESLLTRARAAFRESFKQSQSSSQLRGKP